MVISVLFDVRASKRPHTFFGYILYYSTDELQAQDLKYICQIRDNDLIYITQLSQVPQKCGTFMLVPQVPQMWYKCGTKKRPHTFLDIFCIMHLI